jgi:hypothetical protein
MCTTVFLPLPAHTPFLHTVREQQLKELAREKTRVMKEFQRNAGDYEQGVVSFIFCCKVMYLFHIIFH